MLIFAGCNKMKDRTADMAELKLIESRVDSAFDQVSGLELPKIQSTINVIKDDLSTLEKGYSGTMSFEDALNMDKYKDITKLYKRFDLGQIGFELSMTKDQLSKLSELIQTGATKDKNGNVIDDIYIDKAFKSEKEYAENLLKEIDLMEERKEEFFTRFKKMKPYVDSLISTMPTETE